ncbi:MAG: acetolactate synthase small subunit [Veillonellaceae bacterium]|nr:acetolactate synthase small subunit [Veillonellaceae bacterium]
MASKEHEILVIAKNTPGIGARVLSLFNRRGFSVIKMTSGKTVQPGYARLTLTVDADDQTLDQIQKQIYKLIDVVKVKVFPEQDVVRRELMLIKVKADAQTRSQIAQITDIYRGNILDVGSESLIIELTGDTEKLQGFIKIMRDYGILEIAKTGITAMSRGERM